MCPSVVDHYPSHTFSIPHALYPSHTFSRARTYIHTHSHTHILPQDNAQKTVSAFLEEARALVQTPRTIQTWLCTRT